MAQHAKLLERQVNGSTPGNRSVTLLFEISDDTLGVIGQASVPDGQPAAVKAALKTEATRLLALPIGIVLDL